MRQYVDLLKKIMLTGEVRGDRTGTGTRSIFGGQIEFDLTESFPLVTVKKTMWKTAFIEMLWFLRGEDNTKYLKEYGVNIWDAWADSEGQVGPIYGVQWRHWPGKVNELVIPEDKEFGCPEKTTWEQSSIDQIKELIHLISTQPMGRRHIVTAWNPAYLKDMSLPPCHRDFHCYVSTNGHLDLMMSIRSWDTVLGGPFNIAQYALLTHLIARATKLTPRRLIITYGDAHIYLSHTEGVAKLLAERRPISCTPKIVFKTANTDIDGYMPGDFDVEGYEFHPFMNFPIAV